MLFKNISILDENNIIRENMFLGTKGDRIVFLSEKEPENQKDFGEIFENGKNKLIIPAFCSAHNHMAMSLLRGYGENMSLMDWLTKKIFPFEGHLTGRDIYYSTMLSAAEAFRFGVVSVSDMYFFGEDMAKAVIDSGIKGNVCVSVSCFDDRDFTGLPVYDETEKLFSTFDNSANGRVKVDMCLHSEYTTTEKVVRKVAEIAKANNRRIQVHVSETLSEVEACKSRHNGMTPVEYLENCGVFDSMATAAHCVHISESDMDILKAKNVTVATCPKSNLKLQSGICPVKKLLDKGINVAVSTDGTASNNNLNILEEAKFMNLLQKAENPQYITPEETINAVSYAGFKSQGRNDSGKIREGMKADLVVLNTDSPYMKPVHNMLNNLIYSACGTDVYLTMSDGVIVYRNGEYPTIDLERVEFEVENSRNRILSELS